MTPAETPDSAPQPADRELMAAAGQGDQDAFSTLIHRHQVAIVNYFRRMGVLTDAEDMAQNTFVRIYRYRKRYRPNAKFTTFLYMIARQVWIDHIRKVTRQRQFREAYKQDAEASVQLVDTAEDRKAQAMEAMEALQPDAREVVVLSLFQGLTYEEIGETLGIPLGTVKSRMFYAIRKMREHVHDNG